MMAPRSGRNFLTESLCSNDDPLAGTSYLSLSISVEILDFGAEIVGVTHFAHGHEFDTLKLTLLAKTYTTLARSY